jgi:perosamine synthetase
MEKLAILGGNPIRKKLFPGYRIIGEKEKRAALKVLDSGVLSKYLGCWDPDFYGGTEVQALEKEWAKYFKVRHAIAVNSCTSGLQAAMGAIGIEPGDEVIVTPYSMCVSATAPLLYGAIPVFADIEHDFFCLDPASVEKKITPRTKAIIVVDLFGQPYDADKINEIAKRHKLFVIEDCAQAIGAKHKERFAGTLGHIGVYSLNYHKHIHTGEGGVVVTDDDNLAERLQLIRNHGEAVVEGKGVSDLTNMVGFNFRLTEIQAAIARQLLKKFNKLLDARIKNCQYLAKELMKMPGITPAPTRSGAKHAYYVQPFLFDEREVGISREKFIDAVKAELPVSEIREHEGVLISYPYVKPLYLLPVFQKQIAFGKRGYPFKSEFYKGSVFYRNGLCPVVERLDKKEFFSNQLIHAMMTKKDLDDVIGAFKKVYENRDQLKNK